MEWISTCGRLPHRTGFRQAPEILGEHQRAIQGVNSDAIWVSVGFSDHSVDCCPLAVSTEFEVAHQSVERQSGLDDVVICAPGVKEALEVTIFEGTSGCQKNVQRNCPASGSLKEKASNCENWYKFILLACCNCVFGVPPPVGVFIAITYLFAKLLQWPASGGMSSTDRNRLD